MSFPQILEHIEKSHVFVSLDKLDQAKSEVSKASKLINALLTKQNEADPAIIKLLSKYILDHYDGLKRQQQQQRQENAVSTSTKLLWLSSKLANECVCYPVLTFGPGLDSTCSIFIDTKANYEDPDSSLMLLPTGIDAVFTRVSVRNWTTEESSLSNLCQDLLENCSFVSSFLSLIDQRFDIVDSISPKQESQHYCVVLHYNGARRRVNIDNQLPIIPNSQRNLFMKAQTGDELYWPALIEKAYLKIIGSGYAVSGSNMANDTHILSGWLPEIIRLKQGELPGLLAKFWPLKQKKQVILGIGTGKLSKRLGSQLNLISEHDYMIDNVGQGHDHDQGQGSITLKNPWLDTDSKNRYITTDDLSQFRYLYVNWRQPDVEQFTENFIYSKKNIMADLPRFTLECTSECWLLLERHLPSERGHWSSIDVFESKYRVLSPIQAINFMSCETNNRLQLLKLKPGAYTVVIWSNLVGKFSLTSYGFPLQKSVSQYKFVSRIKGEWTTETGGGNWSQSSFLDNPMYDITVRDACELTICLYGEGPVNFHFLHTDSHQQGKRLRKFIMAKSFTGDNYNENYQSASLSLNPGNYKLIVSTFQCRTGEYTLLFNSSTLLQVEKISNTTALYSTKTTLSWNNENRFKLYFNVETRNTSVTFKIQHYANSNTIQRQTDYRPKLRASVFDASTRQPVQINEEFDDDTLYGLYVDQKFANPGTYILLVERFEIGFGSCVVQVDSNYKVDMLAAPQTNNNQ
ncbi:uncharacterized protein LODBEIA_P54720 [Lodderomyces beijingensis]|uniref:Cysteine protease RIM13 n=1 Tax=Lodderomyces beijingensis TaxID=1775926 RepID=A0ABP0ZSY3_9ASCO